MNLHDRPLVEQMAVAYATEIARLQADFDQIKRYYSDTCDHVVKLEAREARLRAALEAIIVSDDPVTIAIKALANEEGK